MARPHTAAGWWGKMIDRRAGGRADALARLLGVSDRTLRRWRTGEDLPRGHRLKLIRQIAGPLMNRFDTPEWVNAQIDANK